MNTHPKTIAYIGRIIERPEMFIPDFDVRRIETLLHGFDADYGPRIARPAAEP